MSIDNNTGPSPSYFNEVMLSRDRISKWPESAVSLFMDGHSITHIVYLLDYKFRPDAVENAIRDHVKRGGECK